MKDNLSYKIYALLNKPITKENLDEAYRLGLIRKEDLKNGKSYEGHCRNASVAVWHKEKNRFEYIRHKFGNSFPETIPHPEDDEGFDIFTPIKEKD